MSAIGVRLREVDHEQYPVELLIQQGRCRLKRVEANICYRIYFANCNKFITLDHENIVQAEQILLLNGFMKKSTKDYKKEIQKAQHILDTYYEKED